MFNNYFHYNILQIVIIELLFKMPTGISLYLINDFIETSSINSEVRHQVHHLVRRFTQRTKKMLSQLENPPTPERPSTPENIAVAAAASSGAGGGGKDNRFGSGGHHDGIGIDCRRTSLVPIEIYEADSVATHCRSERGGYVLAADYVASFLSRYDRSAW